ncbi:MAG: hypothetical protein AM325_014505 [Candidatus Thorarchaeota archaeon SMTZ1-45]|nr:MAG: hypothetical protein AM325_15970 [Candidatus Thorarchaeota archaeon SMTZ1-45]
MKIINTRLVYAIVLVMAVALYTVALLSLDYTLAGDGYSPFKTWSPIQTAYFAIVGFVFLSILILYDVRDRNTNLRGLIHTIPIIGISFLVLFSMDSRQVLHYLPYLQVFLFDDFGSLFLFGGLLAVYLTYLVSVTPHKNMNTQSRPLEFGTRLILVVFFGPILLGPAFYFGISVCLALGLEVFPFYGEGIIGSVLVVSVLLGLYTTARILSYLYENDLPALKSIKLGQGIRVIFEFIAVYLCTAAAFSLVGGLVTDGVPIPELVPLTLLFLGFYSVIPFSVLLTWRKVFPISSS